MGQSVDFGARVDEDHVAVGRVGDVFLDPTAAAAVIDRIVHHATVLQTTGDSYRLAAAKRSQAPASGKKGAR